MIRQLVFVMVFREIHNMLRISQPRILNYVNKYRYIVSSAQMLPTQLRSQRSSFNEGRGSLSTSYEGKEASIYFFKKTQYSSLISKRTVNLAVSGDIDNKREALKENLKSSLKKYNGDTSHVSVSRLIKELVELNPNLGEAIVSPLFNGKYTLLTPTIFPGKIKQNNGDESIAQYTLGRLSFNIFQPQEMVCTLKQVRNTVFPIDENDRLNTKLKNKLKFNYQLISDITLHTQDGDVPAILKTDAICYKKGNIPNRIHIAFQSETLLPTDETMKSDSLSEIWHKSFHKVYSKSDQDRSLFNQLSYFAMKVAFGLNLPNDSDTDKGFRFEMKRSPVGYIDVLYLDKDLRITKGNRGTLVVVERLNES